MAADEMLSFRLLAPATSGPRLGRLAARGVQIDTPAFIAPSSRGVVPHLSHDNLRDHTAIQAAYVALEDCTRAPRRRPRPPPELTAQS